MVIQRFKQSDIVTQLLYINIGLFFLFIWIKVLFTLFNAPLWGEQWLALSTHPIQVLKTPWTLISYMFLHADVLHLLFNMLLLWFFGKIFLGTFSAKHLLGLYFLGGILGGVFFILAYNVFPYFTERPHSSLLMGSSASVLGIAIATAVYAPNTQVLLLLFGKVRLKYLALFMVATDLLLLTSDNAGGHFAHLGGAVAGWLFVWGFRKGIDFTAWINTVIDLFRGISFQKPKQPKMKVHHTRTAQQAAQTQKTETHSAASSEIEPILEKLRQSGYSSLTAAEKKQLFDASKR